MRGFGQFLMVLGAVLGIGVGLSWLAGINLPDIPWIVAVGLVKLSLIASVGLIGAGATLVRIQNRRQRQVPAGAAETDR